MLIVIDIQTFDSFIISIPRLQGAFEKLLLMHTGCIRKALGFSGSLFRLICKGSAYWPLNNWWVIIINNYFKLSPHPLHSRLRHSIKFPSTLCMQLSKLLECTLYALNVKSKVALITFFEFYLPWFFLVLYLHFPSSVLLRSFFQF